jgi:ABC-2 type transport system ATP-binding protein
VLFSSHQLDLVEHVWEDVVIVDHGRVVVAGDLEELRASVPQRYVEVQFRGAVPDWSELCDVEVVEAHEGHARLRVKRSLDVAQVAAHVERSAHIESFSYEPPTLSELFRQAVGT